MWAKLKKLFAPLSAEDIMGQAPVDLCVGEPVLSFVRCVKAHPQRFRCRPSSATAYGTTHGWQKERGAFYAVADKKLGITFQLLFMSGRLYSVNGVSFDLNGWESKYLHEQLEPVFMKAVTRWQAIRGIRGRIAYDAKAQVQAGIREQWRKLYGID